MFSIFPIFFGVSSHSILVNSHCVWFIHSNDSLIGLNQVFKSVFFSNFISSEIIKNKILVNLADCSSDNVITYNLCSMIVMLRKNKIAHNFRSDEIFRMWAAGQLGLINNQILTGFVGRMVT